MALSVGNHPAQRSAHGPLALVTFDGSFFRKKRGATRDCPTLESIFTYLLLFLHFSSFHHRASTYLREFIHLSALVRNIGPFFADFIFSYFPFFRSRVKVRKK